MSLKSCCVDFADVPAGGAAVADWQAELLVEVAVVEIALPVDRQEVSAHDMLHVLRTVGCAQQLQVAVELAPGDENRPEALDRHVRQGEQLVEDDAELSPEMLPVSCGERCLRWWQGRSLRVEDEIELQSAAGYAVAERVQTPQPADAAGKAPLAALLVNIALDVAGQRGDDLDVVRSKENGQIFLPGFLEDGEVAAVDDPHASLTAGDGQAPEMWIEFRRSARQVEGPHFGAGRNEGKDGIDGLGGHLLSPLWTGIDVAMETALVAAVAEVDLQDFDRTADQRRESAGREQGQCGMHQSFSNVVSTAVAVGPLSLQLIIVGDEAVGAGHPLPGGRQSALPAARPRPGKLFGERPAAGRRSAHFEHAWRVSRRPIIL